MLEVNTDAAVGRDDDWIPAQYYSVESVQPNSTLHVLRFSGQVQKRKTPPGHPLDGENEACPTRKLITPSSWWLLSFESGLPVLVRWQNVVNGPEDGMEYVVMIVDTGFLPQASPSAICTRASLPSRLLQSTWRGGLCFCTRPVLLVPRLLRTMQSPLNGRHPS